MVSGAGLLIRNGDLVVRLRRGGRAVGAQAADCAAGRQRADRLTKGNAPWRSARPRKPANRRALPLSV